VSILDCKCKCHKADASLPAHLSAGCPTAEKLLAAVKAAHATGYADGLRKAASACTNKAVIVVNGHFSTAEDCADMLNAMVREVTNG
jgi:hypothetical protein